MNGQCNNEFYLQKLTGKAIKKTCGGGSAGLNSFWGSVVVISISSLQKKMGAFF